MPSITSRTSNSAVVNDSIPLPKTFPGLPEPVKKRFPEMADWEESTRKWWSSAFTAITEFNRDGVTIINQNYAAATNLRVSVNGLTAEIEEINEVIVTNNTAFARRLVSVSAMAGTLSNIVAQNTAPGGPSVNDYWIDNSDPLEPITYQWDGADWVEVTTQLTTPGVAQEVTARIAAVTNEQTARITADGILASDISTVAAAVVTEAGIRAAAVSAEATARATADGFLEGKYTLTVAAGDVVTGMNITSASGAGTNISSVTFVADDFKIYNSVTGVQMFSVSGTAVKLGATLTVDTANSKVYIGTGTFNNTNTAFYVDSTGQFSLKDQLSWDGTLLSISGDVASGGLDVGTAGNIRGGQTAYNTGAGFWIGYDTVNGDYRLSMGDGGNKFLNFDGSAVQASQLSVQDYLLIASAGPTNINLNTTALTAYVDLVDGSGSSTLYTTQLNISGTKVVGQQGAAVADSTGAGDVVAQLNTLLARIRAHGLIDT